MTHREDDVLRNGPSDREFERLCLRNLLAARDERFFFKDLASRFLLVSDGWRSAIARDLPLEEIVGKSDFDFFTPPHASAAYEDEQRIIRTGEPVLAKIERETFADRPDEWVSTSKWPMRDPAGMVVGTFGISHNVSAQMRDPATGLSNRLALMDRLRQALAALERQPGRIALLFLDIDGFKAVNDTWGHNAGDQVLNEIAGRLSAVSRRFDTVARYGGDEFVILLTALRANENLRVIGERVMRAVSVRIGGIGDGVRLSASVGAVVCDDPNADAAAVLDAGDTAMYAAKREGGGRLSVFDASVHRLAQQPRAARRAQ